MSYSIAMTDRLHLDLIQHLVRRDGQEDLCFAVWFPSTGQTRKTALLYSMVPPGPGDRVVHGNVEFLPQYVERAVQVALDMGGGLGFLHSHPTSGWQEMSEDDARAEEGLAPTVQGATGLPLVGLTLGAGDGTWSGRFWERVGPRNYKRFWCEKVRVVGERLKVDYSDHLLPPPPHRLRQTRTVAAWGPEAQGRLARLRVGVVGLGSVGSVVAEALARTGVQRIELLDFESLEELNLDRTLHAHLPDVGRSKVEISADALRLSATAEGFQAGVHELSVCEDEGYRRALDCDVLFSCVDRPWPRSVLNFLAYAHLIPVIDGGIFVSRTPSKCLRGVDLKAHTVTHWHRCLRCLGQYDPGLVSAEQHGDLADPSYIESLPEDHPVRANENTFAFSLATAALEVLQLVMLVVGPSGLGPRGPQNYHLVTGTIDIGGHECDDGCVFPELTARGDSAGHPGTGTHKVAEEARNNRGRHH